MRVLVIGTGAVGGVLCKLLAEGKEVEEVVCCDIKENEKFNSKKIKFKKISVLDKQEFLKFLKEIKPDVVVNAVLPIFNTVILEYCLKAKTNYLDMASFWDFDKNPRARSPYKFEELDYHEKFKQNDIFGLMLAGVSPGITNLLAREASEQLDETDDIKMRLIEDTGGKELFFSWSKEWLIDEIDTKPLIYRDGKFKIVEPFTGEEEFDFPAPFNRRKVALLCQDEVGSIPLYIKVKNVDLKAYDNMGEVAKMLFNLGLTSKKKIEINKTEISPREFLCKVLPDVPKDFTKKKYENAQFVLVVEASGKKNGKKKTIRYSAIFPKQKEINKLKLNASFISYPTALAAKLFVLSIPKIKNKGVFPPEALDEDARQEIIKELKKYCKLNVQIKNG